MATFFSDTFSGSGSVVGRAPDIGFSGLSWIAGYGPTSCDVSGGFLVPAAAVASTSGAGYGDQVTNYGRPLDIRLAFDFLTPAAFLTGSSDAGFLVEVVTGGVFYWAQLMKASPSTTDWKLILASDLNDPGVQVGVIGLATSTLYAGTLAVVAGVATLTALGQTLTVTNAAANAVGLNGIRVDVGKGFAVGYVSVADSADAPLFGAALTAPSATLAAFGGGSAGLVAPSPGLLFTARFSGNGAMLTPPSPSVAAFGGANASVSPPSPTLAAFGGALAALTGPAPALYAAGHDSTGEQAAYLTAPRPTLAAYGGANARLTAPSPALAITATVTNWGSAALSAPMATLSAAGTTAAMAGAALTAPMATLIGYSGAVCSITGPMGTLQATGTTGAVGRAALVCPLFELTASGTAQNHGSANLIAPSPKLGGTAQAYLIAPMGRLTAIGSAVVVASYEAYSINLSHRGEAPDEVTRYSNFPFTQIVRYRNSYFGVAADGLYLLEGTTDNGAPIAYAVKTCVDDLKVAEKKTAASVYLAGRIGPTLTVTLHAGETGQESYAYSTPRGAGAQNHREKFGRGVKNRYFALGLAGTDALELDSLELEINKLNRKI